jgi:hypothetical protein
MVGIYYSEKKLCYAIVISSNLLTSAKTKSSSPSKDVKKLFSNKIAKNKKSKQALTIQ